ncbi:uncharacterized protein LOC106436291 [Brassica napus]|uniref:uncharacterized protein LOC106436291 n=1 Tax=Brassica napus TaxID=3708 RepID=UPI0006AA98A4|nr:uncharacterized protein LOC106436291 [Brassica napus]
MESLSHLLFECSYASETWSLVPWSSQITIHTNTDFRSRLQDSFIRLNLPPIGAVTNIFPWVCWGIWKARNHLIFQNRYSTPSEVLTKAIVAMREWEQAKALSPKSSTSLTRVNLPLPYSNDVIYCNTDASWNAQTRSAGMAWIFTEQGDKEIARGSIYQEFVSSPSMAEALAIRGALQHAISLHINKISLHSDCKGLVLAISANRRSVELFGVLSDIESSIISFSACSFFSFQDL